MGKKTITSWPNFMKKLKIYKRKDGDNIKYIGLYLSAGGQVYTASFSFREETLKANEEDLEYIQFFAKENIAKDIAKQINSRGK